MFLNVDCGPGRPVFKSHLNLSHWAAHLVCLFICKMIIDHLLDKTMENMAEITYKCLPWCLTEKTQCKVAI